MSDGEFAYNHFTLDELRSLAASPQVGTMQAMPQSFRALADRVGEVADLLTHAQADLPNWWKGPAADQAAATLGRAAAEAREFHDSAMGAATAVSRCAQVVAEQQHQMMNVPDMPEPGVTDAVQRPATPLEALEAARQDARYQAAHEQAVQVVNGIAAQYVETRGQLALVASPRGEGFDLPKINDKSSAGDITEPRETLNLTLEKDKLAAMAGYQPSPRHRPEVAENEEHSINRGSRYTSPTPSKNAHITAFEPGVTISQGSYFAASPSRPIAPITTDHDFPTTQSSHTARNDYEAGADNIDTIESPPRLDTSDLAMTPNSRKEGSLSDDSDVHTRPTSKISITTPTSRNVPINYLNHGESFENYHQARKAPENHDSATPKARDIPTFDDAINDSNALIPPYTGIGPMRRKHEERNPRPAYLKERKSAWILHTAAAPPNGVISPDGFDHS